MTTIDDNEALVRLAFAARVAGRATTVVAVAALLSGLVALAALVPWLSELDGPGRVIGLVALVVLLAAVGRLIWHGRAVGEAFGDPGRLQALLDEVPGAADEVGRALSHAAAPTGWGIRRAVGAWRTLTAVRDVWQDSPVRARVDALVQPIRPEACQRTWIAASVAVAALALGVPVALGSMAALLVT